MDVIAQYDKVFCEWSSSQAFLLRNKEIEQLDFENLIEEIESLGASDQRAFTSYLARILQHLLKVKYQPNKKTKSWDRSIKLYRSQSMRILKKNPSFKNMIPEFFSDAYQMGCLEAAKETGLDIETFPEECEWTIEEVLGE